MKVAELIEILMSECRPDDPVWLAYDSLVCIYPLTVGKMFVITTPKSEYKAYPKGVYLCAMDESAVAWHLGEDDGTEHTCSDPAPGERITK